ncbi:MAG: ABC transporter ATP-binding protein, partial [Bacteroidia bacterium]|nr:ABC transporter ATP-binding protein [Bacteroidia bacterium]
GLSLSDETPFEGTLRENITFGDPDISDEQIYWALDQVGLSSFLRDQANGLITVLYPEGKQISYSVAKKIILARAIVSKPKLLILEDSLDQLELHEAEKIMRTLTAEDAPWTLVVVSMNDRWQSFCAKNVVLKQGKIAA